MKGAVNGMERERHFCTCTDFGCEFNPKNHSNGCDPCIKSSLEDEEIPTCFFRKISEDISEVKEFTFEDFTNFFLKHKETYLKKKKEK